MENTVDIAFYCNRKGKKKTLEIIKKENHT